MRHIDSTMAKALLLLLGVVGILFLLQLVDPGQFTLVNLAVGLLLEVAWSFLLVFAVKFVREYHFASGAVSVWGFFWRSILAKYLGLFLGIAIGIMLPFTFTIPSTGYTLFQYSLAMILSVVAAWALFSVNRRIQLVRALGVFNTF